MIVLFVKLHTSSHPQQNVNKTVAVLFTHRIDKIESNLLIRGQPIKIDKTVKLLGLIFDSKLNWNAHIAHLEEKCKKRLNLMRMLSGVDRHGELANHLC